MSLNISEIYFHYVCLAYVIHYKLFRNKIMCHGNVVQNHEGFFSGSPSAFL